MNLKYIYHGNMDSRPTTFFFWSFTLLKLILVELLLRYGFSLMCLFLMFSFPDLHNLFFCLFVFGFFLPLLFFCHKPFWFWYTPALGTCAHKSHKLVVGDSCKCLHLHSFVLTTYSSFLLSGSLCNYSQCDQNRDEFVFYFTLIFTTSSVS